MSEYAPDTEGLFDTGEISLKDFDDANVPVDIWFEEFEKNEDTGDNHIVDLWYSGYRYVLRCGNYMPRKGRVEESCNYNLCQNERRASSGYKEIYYSTLPNSFKQAY